MYVVASITWHSRSKYCQCQHSKTWLIYCTLSGNCRKFQQLPHIYHYQCVRGKACLINYYRNPKITEIWNTHIDAFWMFISSLQVCMCSKIAPSFFILSSLSPLGPQLASWKMHSTTFSGLPAFPGLCTALYHALWTFFMLALKIVYILKLLKNISFIFSLYMNFIDSLPYLSVIWEQFNMCLSLRNCDLISPES